MPYITRAHAYTTHALTHTPHMHATNTYEYTRFDLFFVLLDECNEVVDYAIAQKIVELHVKQKESIHRVYSQVTICECVCVHACVCVCV